MQHLVAPSRKYLENYATRVLSRHKSTLSWFWLEHSSLAVIHTPAPNCSWAIIKCSIESDSMIVQSPAWSLGDCAQVSLRWKSINQVCNVIYDITHWSMVMYVKVEFSSFCNQHQHTDCDVRVFLDSISYMKQEITEKIFQIRQWRMTSVVVVVVVVV